LTSPIYINHVFAYLPENYSGAYTIPDGIETIAPGAFSWCSVTSVTIPNSVTSIGNHAFEGCTGLKSVKIPNSVTRIGNGAFSNCDNLTSITIPNSVKSIGAYTFRGCEKLKSVTIPNSVKSIGSYAFIDCRGLTSITIPNSVTSIGDEAFSGCKNLTSVTIGNSVTSIGDEAFRGCTGLTSVTIGNSVKSIGDEVFRDCTGLTSITIPNSVTSIGEMAFFECGNLTSVTIGNRVKSIGKAAFYGCSGLTSITIPNSVKSIGVQVFEKCKGLKSPVYSDYVFAYLPENYSGAYTIPDGIETIAPGAFSHNSANSILGFSNCDSLTSITIPNSVTSIGDWAFFGCGGLTSITIPNSVTRIGSGAFADTGLKSVTIPNSVTSIGDEAFSNCYPLTSVTIPNSVKSIGERVFEKCKGLKSPVYNNHVFAYLPENYSGAYTIPDGIETIAPGALNDCKNLTSITIPNSVTSIGIHAFSGCTNLTSITCYAFVPPHAYPQARYGEKFSEVALYVPVGFSKVYKNSRFGWQFGHVEEIYIKPAILLSKELNVVNELISKLVPQRNEVSSCSPYAQYLNEKERNRFLLTYSPIHIPDAYDYDQAKAFCDSLQRVADSLSHQDSAQTITSIKDYLRTTRPDDFIKAYFHENPTAKAHLESEHKEYRCHYASFTDFVIQYEQGRLQPSERNCRELKWQEYNQYYRSKEAFNADYDKGDAHLEAHKKRELKWREYGQYYSDREAFDVDYNKGDNYLEAHKKREIKWAECADYYEARYIFDFDYDKGETVVDAHRRRIDEAWSSLQQLPEELLVKKKLIGASESKKEDILNLFSLYRQLKPSPHFQSLAADFLISSNKKMSKEYEKNGAYFSSKIAFLTAYFSGDYKHIIKSLKK